MVPVGLKCSSFVFLVSSITHYFILHCKIILEAIFKQGTIGALNSIIRGETKKTPIFVSLELTVIQKKY